MANSKDYITYIYDKTDITTVDGFIGDMLSIIKGWKKSEFFAYIDEYNISNLDHIWEKYSKEEQAQYQGAYNSKNLSYIKVGTILALDKSKLYREVLYQLSNFSVEEKSFKEFYVKALRELENDDRYIPIAKNQLQSIGITKSIYPQITVWLWCRSLSDYDDKKLQGKIINLSPFIESCNINVTESGGNFQLSLSPLIGEYINYSGWKIKGLSQYGGNDINYVALGSLHKKIVESEGNVLKRNDFYFHNIINENDIIFIRYETLENEVKERIKDNRNFEISKDDVPNRIYDMIGLVDSNTISVSGGNSNVSIDIAGRDLIKLVIEDGCYFYPLEFMPGGMFANEKENQQIVQRIDGKLVGLQQYAIRSLEFIMKFIVNALANIGICPDELLLPYQFIEEYQTEVGPPQVVDKRSKFFRLTDKSQQDLKKIEDNKTDIGNAIITEVGESRIEEKIDDATNWSAENDISKHLIDFLKAGKEKSSIKEINGDLLGWNEFVDESENIKRNEYPKWFQGKLFKIKGHWEESDWAKGKKKELEKYYNDMIKDQVLSSTTQTSQTTNQEIEDRYGKPVLVEQEEMTAEVGKSAPINEDEKKEEVKIHIATTEEIQKAIEKWNTSGGSNTNQTTPLPTPDWKKLKENWESERAKELKVIVEKSNKFIIEPTTFDNINEHGKLATKKAWEYIKSEKNYDEFKGDIEDKPMKGIWQIIKLIVDDNVKDRRIVDSSIGNEMGSILNPINKICQKPFVEFFTDTYKDQFYFIIRKLPYDYDGYDALRRVAIDIKDEDVISEQLDFGKEGIYSWYRLTPQSLVDSVGTQVTWAYLKAVHFQKYTDIWGDKPLDIVTNYIPYEPIEGQTENLSSNYFIKQGILDLKFLIDIHAYMPFTRTGTITLNGDRRIKRGTVIRYQPTGEVFIVEAVNNSFSVNEGGVDRVTTIQVTRGMVEKYFPYYFKIIDTKIDSRLFTESKVDDEGISYQDYMDSSMTNWRVNEDIFNAFLRRKQFTKEFLEKDIYYDFVSQQSKESTDFINNTLKGIRRK